MTERAYIITAPDGSMGVWSTRGFRFIPAPSKAEYPRLLAMGFTAAEIEPLARKAEAAGVLDVERYIIKELIG